jgi:hypothetical protein
MPEPTNPALATETCRCLRWKEMFYEVEGAPANPLTSGSGIYWCIHTHNCLGPDGSVAEPTTCKTGRTCFDPL